MSTKNSFKPDALPNLKLASPRDISKSRFLSMNNSPTRLDFLTDHGETGKASHRGDETKKFMTGINFANFHVRTGSLAGQSERVKKAPNFLPPELTPSDTHMNFLKKEDNAKKIALWEKINKLKSSLTRYSDPDEVIIIPTRLEVKKIISCLELLNDTSSGFADLMSIVVKVLKAGVYVDAQMIEPFEEKLYEDCDDELKNVVQNCKKEATPYYVLCLALLRELTSDTRRGQKTDKHQQEVQKLQEELENSETIAKDLAKELKKRITPQEHTNLLQDIEHFKFHYTEANKENIGLKNHLNEVIEENTTLRKQMDSELAEIEKHLAHIQALERARDNVIKETEESRKQIDLMKLKIKGFKDVMDKIIIKLGNVKQQVYDLRHENEELLYQNEKLSLRAARGFEALTPRPDYRKLIEEKRLDFDVYDTTGRRQMVPTIKVVEDLLNKINLAKEKEKEGAAKKKGTAIHKVIAGAMGVAGLGGGTINKVPSQGSKRPSISLHPPKTRPSILEGASASPMATGQKNFYVKEPSFNSVTANTSPRNGANGPRASTDAVHKEEKASSKSELESQTSDNEDTMTINKSISNNFIKKPSRNEEKNEGLFGEDTIRQANHLIDYAVSTKKAIDKLE